MTSVDKSGFIVSAVGTQAPTTTTPAASAWARAEKPGAAALRVHRRVHRQARLSCPPAALHLVCAPMSAARGVWAFRFTQPAHAHPWLPRQVVHFGSACDAYHG
eukprot:CAMPEP_0204230974 /NCGR_PEP_ID=MMETSP0361-20130328/88383_1 /ASSEMBLY_ACC=CAM_ASM_000343 /TAXON_ID=268821 /ORGANISM="Scrippsiella Hangoei, Strain SHTV-5" /LENGTH=103 /DNA_ID=CAMNT_0051200257 /DNA_START=128 /DNA_END=436 /DNA_ORIENTATION=-